MGLIYLVQPTKFIGTNIISDLMNSLIKNISRIYDETTCKHIFQYIAEQTKIIS